MTSKPLGCLTAPRPQARVKVLDGAFEQVPPGAAAHRSRVRHAGGGARRYLDGVGVGVGEADTPGWAVAVGLADVLGCALALAVGVAAGAGGE